MSLRHLARHFQPAAEAAATIDPDDFVEVVDNPYFTLQPGATFYFENEDGSARNEFVVTRETIEILGVTCVVVHDTAFEDGEVVEDTFDYFAQDKEGNVWYFGEDTREFVDGEVVSTAGTWRAGVDGALPGIIMLDSPVVGAEYNQENAPGVAQDRAEVLSLAAPASAPYAEFDETLQTLDTTPLDPSLQEHKFYGPGGVGLVKVEDLVTGDIEQLVKIKFDGTGRDDTLAGNVGIDELNGLAGDDELDGKAGSDTLHGGRGDDTLDGGGDDVADLVHGDKGDDLIRVATADAAFGDDGDDLLELDDTIDFGTVDGGDQHGHNLARIAGDILQFDGELDLTAVGVSERITGIETLSMKDIESDGALELTSLKTAESSDTLTLSAQDVLDLGDGDFNPRLRGDDEFDLGAALRVDGDCGDQLALTDGNWTEIAAKNAPDDYSVFACQSAAGSAYVLVQEDVTVVLD